MAYDVPQPSSNPWEEKVNYAVFSFTVAFQGSTNWTLWMSNPQGSLAPISCGLSCSTEYPHTPVPFASGTSIKGFWFTEMDAEGNYTLWMQNVGPGLAYGNVTLGTSAVVYSRPYFFAGVLTIIPAAGYIGLVAYSFVRSKRTMANQERLEAAKTTSGEKKNVANSIPALLLKCLGKVRSIVRL